MRARTVGDLRRELDGVDDALPLTVEMPEPYIARDIDGGREQVCFDRSGTRIDSVPINPLDVERVEVTTGQVILHIDGDLP